MQIKRIAPKSAAKVLGITNAFFGLIIGGFFSLASMFALRQVGAGMSILGIGAVIALPIFYGVLGVVMGFIGAWIYNVAAKFVGGIEIETE